MLVIVVDCLEGVIGSAVVICLEGMVGTGPSLVSLAKSYKRDDKNQSIKILGQRKIAVKSWNFSSQLPASRTTFYPIKY